MNDTAGAAVSRLAADREPRRGLEREGPHGDAHGLARGDRPLRSDLGEVPPQEANDGIVPLQCLGAQASSAHADECRKGADHDERDTRQ